MARRGFWALMSSLFGGRPTATEEDWRALALETAGGGAWQWDLDTDAVEWSAPLYRLHGLAVGPVDGGRWLGLLAGEQKEAFERILAALKDGRSHSLRLEYDMPVPAGQHHLLLVGEVGGKGRSKRVMQGVAIDMPERRASIRERMESEERYRTLFDMAPVGIIMVEPAGGRVVAFNAKAHQTLGYNAEEFRALSLGDLDALDVSGRSGPPTSLSELAASDRTVQFETRHKRKDGSVVEVLVSAHRTLLNGQVYLLKIWQDITELKRIERQLQAAKATAERADRAKGQFLASASHDLRQPVQSLVFFHSALAAKLKGHQAYSLVDHMQVGLDALKTILDGLLDISKLHAGTVEVQAGAFPVNAILGGIEADYAGRAADKGLLLRVVASSLWVRSDMELLNRILRQFVDNAIKYSNSGGVVVGCRRLGNSVRISVVDTGTGIPNDKLDEIFQEFVQLGNPERDRSKGLGLGLAIVRHLGQLLGHDVAVRSRPGYGTTFSVTVPMARPRSAAKRRASEPAGIEQPNLALVIDDENLILAGLRAVLELQGWEVTTAVSGAEALGLVTRARIPDVIIADYRLRGSESGPGVIAELRAACGQPIPGLVLTGDTGPERILECQRSGLALMHKPVVPADLHRTLAEILPARGEGGRARN